MKILLLKVFYADLNYYMASSGVHPASYPVDIGGCFLRVKAAVA
jgi:hypothetical protein